MLPQLPGFWCPATIVYIASRTIHVSWWLPLYSAQMGGLPPCFATVHQTEMTNGLSQRQRAESAVILSAMAGAQR